MPTDPIPIACNFTAIDREHREQHMATTQQLFEQVEAVRELPNGYAFRLPNNTDTFLQAACFIAHERDCCPFFHFEMALEPAGGPFWLRLTGREGVKQFVWAEFGPRLNEAAAQAAQPDRF